MSIERVSATRGVLLRLKEQLKFIIKGKELLKMKRDNLASELNKLMVEVEKRRKMEQDLNVIYEELKRTLSLVGYSELASAGNSVGDLRIKILPVSIMGVIIPRLKVEAKPDTSNISNIAIRGLAEKFNNVLSELITVIQVESALERVAKELKMLNRKVNALEKTVIPQYQELIRKIEDTLEEEALEEFCRMKMVREVIEKRREI